MGDINRRRLPTMPHPQTNFRIPPSLKAAAQAAADARGITLSELATLALTAYLASPPDTMPDTMPTTTPDTTPDTLARVEALEVEVEALAQRVEALEAVEAVEAVPTPTTLDTSSTTRADTTPASLSDSVLRRQWAALGRPGPGFIPWAQGQGWQRIGRGNKSQWHRAGE